MKSFVAIIGLFLASPVLAAELSPVAKFPVKKFNGWNGPKPSKPPCECRHRNGKASIGQKLCMRQGDKLVTMECKLVLNNTAWQKIVDSCDVAMN